MSRDSRLAVTEHTHEYDFENLTVADTAVGLTASKWQVVPYPQEVWIVAETAPLRYRMDGTNPTTTIGQLLLPTDLLVIKGYTNISKLKFIRQTATSGAINVSYRR